MVSGLSGDLASGLRAFRHHPATTLSAVLVLALGIGTATSVFSVLYATVLRPLPFPDPDRLVALATGTPDDPSDNWSGPDFLDVRREASLLDGVAGSRWLRFALTAGTDPEEVRGVSVTDNFFDVLGAAAERGQVSDLAARRRDGGPLVVLSHGLWQARFGASEAAIGASITLNDRPYTVVAVMPRAFDYPHGAALWTISPLGVPEPPFDFGDNPERLRGAHYFDAITRLRPGVTRSEASDQVRALTVDLEKRHGGTNVGRRARLVPLVEAEVGDLRTRLWLLMGAVAGVLLIGCANVANLLVIRAADRDREVLIRVAIGASGGRLVRLFLVEGLLLGLVAGGLGSLLAAWGLEAILALVPDDVPRLAEVRLDLPALGFALMAAVVASVLAGLAPALHAFRRRRTGSGLTSRSRASARRTRGALVVVEVAASVVLLLGAGLMLRTLAYLGRVDPGFRPESTAAGRVSLPESSYAEDARVLAFSRAVLERLRATPGIVSAGAAMSLPVDASGSADLRVYASGRPAGEPGRPAGFQPVTAGYFETMGIPLHRGRLFTEDDREERPLVAIVSESFARRFFPSGDPIGQRLAWSDPADAGTEWHVIVGVVGDTRHRGLHQEPRAEAYVPLGQAPIPYMWFVARGSLGLEATSRAIRSAVAAADPGRPVSPLRALDEVVRRSMAGSRFTTLLLGGFAGLALFMAAFGLYAVLACGVAQRSHEIGIRMALGASRSSVVGAIVGEGTKLAAAGLSIGLVGAAAVSRFIASHLHGVRPADPLSIAAAVTALGAAAILASLLPAWRAARVDPSVSLRTEV